MTDPQILDGRYQLVRPLGQGAMGRVWLAHDLVLERPVAVKQLITDTPDAETVGRAVREAKLAGRLQHPNAVAVHDLVTVNGRPHVVMEYIEGRSLAELAPIGGLPVSRIAEILAEVAGALAAAHELGIVHRDVKPANIMITADGRAKLADFGIARSANTGALTRTGLVIGTLAYMAPEVAGGSSATAAADVWSLGATAFTLTEGRAPYRAESDVALYGQLISQDPPRPVAAGALTDPIMRMMQRDPHRRPATRAMQREMARIGRTPEATGLIAPPSSSAAPPAPPSRQWSEPMPAVDAPYQPLPPIRPSSPVGPPTSGRDPFASSAAGRAAAGVPFFGDDDEPRSARFEELLRDEDDEIGSDRRGRRPSGLAIAIAALVVLIVIAGVAVLLKRSNSGSTAPSSIDGAATTTASSPASSAVPTSSRYSGPGGITVSGPVGWTKSPGTGEIPRISSLSPAGSVDKDSATYFRFGIGSAEPATDFNAVARESIAFVQTGSKYTNKMIVGSPRYLTYLGVQAVDIEWTGRDTFGSDRHLIERVWLSKTVTWLIQVNSPAASWDSTLALFTQLTSTCTVP